MEDNPQPSTSQTMPSTPSYSFHGIETSNNVSLPSSKQQRRVSLPASPRQPNSWSFRDDTGISKTTAASRSRNDVPRSAVLDDADNISRRIGRKKWTSEETNMLVEGCRKHGVGNWKLMVEDPELSFDNRSPVDLKDRFRTYFNDSYRQLYPNAKTHLSTNTARGINPDGTSLFDKMRSRKRKPFTPEEDAALRTGYEKYGTSWATIVKNPVFQIQNRRSTDLRDRFRNAFPDLYLSAGYKPRPSISKSASVPKPAKRRKGSDGDLPPPLKLRRGRRATVSDLPDDRRAVSDGEFSSDEVEVELLASNPPLHSNDNASSPPPTPIETEPTNSRALPSARVISQSSATSPAHGQPTAGAGEYFPPTYRTLNMIPKTGWGLQDWLASNPRMDSSPQSQLPLLSQSVSVSSSGPPSSFSPSHSYSHSFSQAVFDRYDLSSVGGHLSNPFNFAQSEAGGYGAGGDDNSGFGSDAENMFAPNTFWGFTHHSNTAGDLIFGTRSQGGYGGHGPNTFLGSNPMQPAGTINPMQLHAIDERVESIRLDDPVPLPTSIATPALVDPIQVPTSEFDMEIQELSTETTSNVKGRTDREHDVVRTPTVTSQPPPPPPVPSHPPSLSMAPSAFRRFTQNNASAVHRSISQPPTSLSSPTLDRPPLLHSNSQPIDASLPSSHLSLVGDDIPFLDLHYWGSNSTPNSMDVFGNSTGSFADQGAANALDLANVQPKQNHIAKPLPTQLIRTSRGFAKPNVEQPVGVSTPTSTTGPPRPRYHQRMHSQSVAEEPSVGRRIDNKRKRVSWDGGP